MTASPLAFGAFKIGRNERIKYAQGYDLPEETESAALLNAVLDLGINVLDTAPAYGLSEERIGRAVSSRRREYVLSTKAGELFEYGESRYDFTASGLRRSVERSLERLQTDAVDLLFLHVAADDVEVLQTTDAVETLRRLRSEGKTRGIGLSSKTPEAASLALDWADALMVEYHLDDRSHEAVIEEAARRGVNVIVKKGLASGRLPAADAVRFVLTNPGVTCLTVGSLNLEHLRQNLEAARAARGREGE